MDWNTTTIPDGVVITNTRVQIYVSGTLAGTDISNGTVTTSCYNMELNWESRTSASAHYSDCSNGASYWGAYTLTQGGGLTPWLDLGATADSTAQTQLGANWFGIGMRSNSEGSNAGVITYLDWSPLELTYNQLPPAPSLVAPAPSGVRTVGNSVGFSWGAVADPDGDPVTYYLYCDTSATPTTLLYSGGGTSYTWGGPVDATTYNWRVRAYDGVSFGPYSATWNFRENGLPAAPANASPANGGFVLAGATTVTWGAVVDPDADPLTYEWRVDVDNPPAAPYTSNGTTAATTSASFVTTDAVTYYRHTRALDGYEMTGFGAVWSFTADGTAPTAGTVNDGAAADIDWQNSTTTISANWSGFADATSGIASYAWAIGTAPGATDVQGWIGVGAATSASNGALALTNGTTYFVSVRATDNVGLVSPVATSDGVTVDAVGPTAGSVNDGVAADVDAQTTSTISANWSGFADALSGIASYEWSVGTAPGATDVQGWVNVGAATSASNGALPIVDGTTYFVGVRAIDNAGNTGAAAASDGVLVDATGPTPGTVADGLAADIDYQTSTTTISANWAGFSDSPGTGIASYEWAIGTAPGASDVQAYTNVGLATSATNAGLSLPDDTYYVSVRGIDMLGNVGAAASSDGVTVDTTGPSAGVVNDGAGADIDFQNSITTISANWSGFADAGGIASYQWAIGTTPGATDVQAYANVGAATSATNAALTLTEGVTYFVSVRAIDNAGNVGAIATSDGVTVDVTPPSLPVLVSPIDGAVTGAAPLLTWTGDGTTYEVELDGAPFASSTTNLQPAPLADGPHAWRVRAFDLAGNATAFTAPWTFTSDGTGPVLAPTLITPANGVTLLTNPTGFTWTAVADPNGIGNYELEVYSGPLVYSASPGVTSHTASLPDGVFTWRVRAVDTLGNPGPWSATFTFTKSSGLETNPPTAPVLVAPPDTSNASNPPTLDWLAATDDTGIAYYQVQVDTEAGFSAPVTLNGTTVQTELVTLTLSGGTYFWRVRAFDPVGNAGAWSAIWSFTIGGGGALSPPPTPTLLLPPNGFLLLPGAVNLNWTDSAGASSYDVQVFQGVTIVYSGTPATSGDTTPALPAGTFAWRVRALNAAGASAWTAPWTFTLDPAAPVDGTPPTAPNQISPADGTLGIIDPTVPLTWMLGTDAESGIAFHLVEVFDAGPTLVFSAELPTGATIDTSFLPNGTYTWRVTAVNGQGLGTTCPTDWTFSVDTTLDVTPPGAVALISPPDGSMAPPGAVTFLWTAGTDNGMVLFYDFQVDTDAAFGSPIAVHTQGSDTNATLTMSMGSYWWRVRAVDANLNAGPWTPAWTLTVGTATAGGGGSSGADGSAGSHGGSSSSCSLGFTAHGAPRVGLLLLVCLGAWAVATRRIMRW